MDQKGILSADLIFATLLLLMVIASALSVISTGMDSAENTEFSKAKVLADSVASTINTAYTNGDGNYIIFNFDNSSSTLIIKFMLQILALMWSINLKMLVHQ